MLTYGFAILGNFTVLTRQPGCYRQEDAVGSCLAEGDKKKENDGGKAVRNVKGKGERA